MRKLIERFRDRTSIRQQTALLAGGLCVLTAGAVALTTADLARWRAAGDAEASLVATARAMADRLDIHMFERYREIGRTAALAPLGSVWRGDPAAIRGVLENLRTSLPEYAWIGFARPDGTVLAATGGMLEGVSVASRPWFANGIDGPTVEDVHDAKLLDGLLRTSPDQAPFRFVDVAFPVRDDNGRLAGVLGAHLGWQWAEDVRRDVLANQGQGEALELLVLGRDGSILVGPPDADLSAAAAIESEVARHGATIADRSGPEPLLTAVVETQGMRDYPGLGWRVVARSPERLALSGARTLFTTILLVGAAAAVVAAALAYVLAGRMMRPLDRLTREVDSIGRDASRSSVAWQRGSSDVLAISAAVRSLLRRIGTAEEGARSAQQSIADAESRAAEAARRSAADRERLDADLDVLRRLAVTDPLSGLLNRRGFLPEGEAALSRCATTGEGAGVLMIDIDHFKLVNDRLGHAAGDSVIRGLASYLTSEIRVGDRAARLGGEEFVALAHGMDEAGVRQLASRIRQGVAETPIVTEEGPVAITVSIGVTTLSPDDRDIDDAFGRADRALYAAKTGGRNRVVSSGELAPDL